MARNPYGIRGNRCFSRWMVPMVPVVPLSLIYRVKMNKAHKQPIIATHLLDGYSIEGAPWLAKQGLEWSIKKGPEGPYI